MTTRKTTSPEERFWAKVRKTDICWLWTAGAFSQRVRLVRDGDSPEALQFLAARKALGSVEAVPREQYEAACDERDNLAGMRADEAENAYRAEAALSEAVGRCDSLASEVEEEREALRWLVECIEQGSTVHGAMQKAREALSRLDAPCETCGGAEFDRNGFGYGVLCLNCSLRDREGGD